VLSINCSEGIGSKEFVLLEFVQTTKSNLIFLRSSLKQQGSCIYPEAIAIFIIGLVGLKSLVIIIGK
jgi:hypothetical protein